ncbi:hypothetical protein D3C76_1094700 [compost metagenome]
MHIELNVLLECRASREWRLVAALQTVQHQAATRRQHITQQRHLRAAHAVEHHVHTTAIGVLANLQQQVLLFGDDHFVCAQAQQVVTLRRFLGGGEYFQPQGPAQLHEGRPGAMAGIGDQCCLPGLGPCQVDVGEVGDQQRGVVHAGLDRGEHIRVARDGCTGQYDDIAVHRVIVGTGGREAGDPITDGNVIDPFPDRSHHPGHFVTDPRWQTRLGRCQILAPKHVIPADANRFDADLHLVGSG